MSQRNTEWSFWRNQGNRKTFEGPTLKMNVAFLGPHFSNAARRSNIWLMKCDHFCFRGLLQHQCGSGNIIISLNINGWLRLYFLWENMKPPVIHVIVIAVQNVWKDKPTLLINIFDPNSPSRVYLTAEGVLYLSQVAVSEFAWSGQHCYTYQTYNTTKYKWKNNIHLFILHNQELK